MTMHRDIEATEGRRRRRGTVLGMGLAGLGVICLGLAAPLSLASAATLDAVATIAAPGSEPGSVTPLTSGGSTTQFTVTLPANAACSGDTATGGYHVYSYLVPSGTDITKVTFVSLPSTGYGFVDTSGTYFGPVNTAVNTGQIVSIPNNFEWAPLLGQGLTVSSLTTSGTTPGEWEAGIACADTTGKLSDYWNTDVTFLASASDPNGFTWTAAASTSTTTTTAASGGTTTTTASDPGATTTTTAGLTGGSTTTTTTAGVSPTGAGTGTDTGSGTGSGATGSSGASGASGSSLASTGLPVERMTAYGLLALGVGLMLLGWRVYRHRRGSTPGAPSPW